MQNSTLPHPEEAYWASHEFARSLWQSFVDDLATRGAFELPPDTPTYAVPMLKLKHVVLPVPGAHAAGDSSTDSDVDADGETDTDADAYADSP